MKKVLFATTALVATAGMAAAEVTLGGYGRFGLYYQENAAGTNETRVEQRFRLTITGSTVADNGLEFEGRIRFQTDENGDGASNTANTSAAGFAVSTGGFRLDVGNVSNVIDSGDVVNYFGYGVGLTSSIEQSNGFGNTAVGFGTSETFNTVAPTIKLRYNVGDFTVSVSYTDDAATTATAFETAATLATGTPPVAGSLTGAGTTAGGGNSSYQLGASYSFGNYAVGAVIGSNETAGGTGPDNDEWIIGFTGEFGALAVSAIVGDSDAQGLAGNSTSFGLSAKYDISAATELRFVYADNGAAMNAETYGIGFIQGLGGGVSLRGGIGESGGNTIADLGVVFNF